jgi:glyoxylase-like metal-dependent hydrolase (beta-lactamase superfamily II)
VRVVSLHPDVILITSAIWQTNCTLVRAGEECFAVDSPILPQELQALPAVLEQLDPEGRVGRPSPSGHVPLEGRASGHAGSKLSGLLATHGDWDHLLGRLAFSQASLGCAQSTVARLQAQPGEAQRQLRAFDEQHYLQREGPLALAALQALPVPGRLEIGAQELHLHPAEGHTADGMAIWVPWTKVLLVGDYLSAVEIPFFGEGNGRLDAYGATLERLRPLVQQAEQVVPGHGPALDRARALTVLDEDLAYLRALRERGGGAPLPPGRRSGFQRQLHMENVAAFQAAQ